MNNILKTLLIFFLITGCSLHKSSNFWTSTKKIQKEKTATADLVEECKTKFFIKKCKLVKKEEIETDGQVKECKTKFFIKRCEVVEGAKEIFAEEKVITSEFNPNKKISLYGKPINKSFFNNYDNNNGWINYDGNLKKISKLKFSKIDNFDQYNPVIIFDKENVIFFDNKGSIIKFDNNSKLVWKKNYYKKYEKKLNPVLLFANNKNTLIVADNISKYYALDINSGKLLWQKNNLAPFNSQVKIYKDKFFVIDLQNTLRCFSIKDGSEIWNVETDNSLIRSQKKLSMVIINEKIYFNNSQGDISAVDINKGELLWQRPTQSSLLVDDGFFLKNSDLIADLDSLYFSNNKNQFFSIDMNTGSLNWEKKINSNIRPTLVNDYLFTVSLEGYLIILEKKSGNLIRSTNVFKNFNFFFDEVEQTAKIKPAGFIMGTNNIYLTTSNGRLIVIDIVTGVATSVLKIDKSRISRPFILNQILFIIKDNSIIKLN